jgi:hypothetical protein
MSGLSFGLMGNGSSLFGHFGPSYWNQIVFRIDTPRILTAEERANRTARRKQHRQNKRKLILRRGYA